MEFIKDFTKDLSIDKVRNIAEDAFNSYKPKSELEERVYEALSHKNWGASSSLMNGIADDTYDYERFNTITKMMWEAMDSRPAAWRVVFKSLGLLEHIVKNGSERCVDDARNHSHKLRSLNNFNYYEGTVDRGAGVREKSKQITELLADSDRIREEREKAKTLREKFGQSKMTAEGGGNNRYEGYGNDATANPNRDEMSFASGGGGFSDSAVRAGAGYGGKKKMEGFGSDDVVDKGYAGRYSGDSNVLNSPARGATRVALPPVTDKPAAAVKKTKKKKKTKEVAAAPAVAEVPVANIDLLSLDDPAPKAPEAEFDAFQGFQAASPTPASAAFQAAPVPFQATPGFDAFAAPPAPAATFDAFATSNNTAADESFTAFESYSGAAQTNGGFQSAPAPDDDDFGDFAGGAKSAAALPVAAKSGDVFSKLVSLDGLTSNKKDQKNPLAQPIAFNQTAAQQIQHKKTTPATNGNSSFRGIDGLATHASPAMANKRTTGQPVMSSSTPTMEASADKMSAFASLGAGMGNPNMKAAAQPGMMPQGGPMTPQQMQQQLQMMMMMQQQMAASGQGDPVQLANMQRQMAVMMQNMNAMGMGAGANTSMGGPQMGASSMGGPQMGANNFGYPSNFNGGM